MTRFLLGLLLTVSLAGCMRTPIPPCPFEGKADFAPSAGCLAVVHGKVLVVESRKGGLTPPGGKALSGESAQCAAYRETYEETGLSLMPRQLLRVFDTGFHLYYCEIHADSGLIATDVMEVRRGFWLPVSEFADVRWRYPGQGEALSEIFNAPAQSSAEPAMDEAQE